MTLIGLFIALLAISLVVLIVKLILDQIPQTAPYRGIILLVLFVLLLLLILTGNLRLGIG